MIYRNENEQIKWNEVAQLHAAIDQVRIQYSQDMKVKERSAKKLAALTIGLIDEASFRIGNKTSAREGVYGISTLPTTSLTINGNEAIFQYPGKKKIKQSKIIRNPDILDELKLQKDYAIQNDCEQLFCLGKNRVLEDDEIRDYLESISGIRKTHRFRALKASQMILDAIGQGGTYEDARNRVSVELGHFRNDKVLGQIPDTGNTAENSYIHPLLKIVFGYGRSSRNPIYHRIGMKYKVKTRREIIEHLRNNPRSEIRKEFE